MALTTVNLPEVGLTPERKMTRSQIEEMVVNMKLAAAQLGSAEMKRAADNFAKSYKKCRPKELIGKRTEWFFAVRRRAVTKNDVIMTSSYDITNVWNLTQICIFSQ